MEDKPMMEYSMVCPKCLSNDFHKNEGFHVRGVYHCNKCGSDFGNPKRVDTVTHVYKNDTKPSIADRLLGKPHSSRSNKKGKYHMF